MEEKSQFAINKIGAYLDDGSIDTVTGPPRPLRYAAQVVETSVISDTINWIKVQGCFVATGTEKFITIGVFDDTAMVTKTVTIPWGCFAQYLIDDVSVIAVDSSADAGHDVVIHTGDTTQIGVSNGAGMPCYWYLLGSSVAIDSGGSTKVHPITSTSYVVKMDLCGTVTMDTVKVWVWPDTPSAVGSLQYSVGSLRVYPNPATSEVTISACLPDRQGAANCEVVFYDMVGREMLKREIKNTKETINIEGLANGMYFVEVVDRETGEKVVRRLVKE